MSADARRPTLLLIAGPNGAGKTTFYETALKPKVAIPFINADAIQKNELNDVSVEASYRAAAIAAERRVDYLERGLSFATETGSHIHQSWFCFERRVNAAFDLLCFICI